MNGKRPCMDYRQYRAARRLVHECCNYEGGNCIVSVKKTDVFTKNIK